MSGNPRPVQFAQIAVSGPLRRSFTYHLDEEAEALTPGQRVAVEFGRSRKVGFYLGPGTSPPGVTTKPVLKVLDSQSYFPPDLFKLCSWVAEYYFANPADVLTSALPPALKATKAARLVWAAGCRGLVPEILERLAVPGRRITPRAAQKLKEAGVEVSSLLDSGAAHEDWADVGAEPPVELLGYVSARAEHWPEFFKRRKISPEPFGDRRTRQQLKTDGWNDSTIRAAIDNGLLEPVLSERQDSILRFVSGREGVAALPLTEEQAAAVTSMRESLNSGFNATLLHGVTGSGKTLVYCHLAREVVEAGRSVLVLTPEIALSGATLAYFRGFFGDRVTVIHSAMTPRERLESWRGILSGRYIIVVGPRSAVFAPLRNLGLVIVDEEHDSSYKQDEPSPRFHGRDTAVMRAKIAGVPAILGSASPSVESYHNARRGRYRLVELKNRPAGASLPLVRLIDLRRERLHGDLPYLSYPLKREVEGRIKRGEQVILFLNRRGYSPQIKCASCGHVPVCPDCEIKLTYHKAGNRLTCHYCGFTRPVHGRCEKCGEGSFQYPGVGTQKVEEHIARLFTDGRVIRFDSDTASGRRNAHDLLREFADGDHNLLLGTQMVTKGLDLPRVSLVGVLSADQGLDFPDFRAGEKTFARLLQVAGRSGRGSNPGEVLIQTCYPESEVIDDAARQDYCSFFDREIASRRDFDYPPFTRLARFVFSSPDPERLELSVTGFVDALRSKASADTLQVVLLGPAPCAVGLLRGSHRVHLLVKCADMAKFGRMLTAWEAEKTRFGLPSKVRLAVDIDPDDMM